MPLVQNRTTTKPTQTRARGAAYFWTADELSFLRQHPDMTAKELSEFLPARSESAIAKMRSRIGRFASAVPICAVCAERVVWVESDRARALGLCKGCFLDEMEQRTREMRRANALRQYMFKSAHKL